VLVINGRFAGRPVTGVERHALGITGELADYRLRIPPKSLRRGPAGHAWEQLGLPHLLGRHDVLWSPCNFGPVTVGRQIVTVHDLAPLDHPEWFGPRYRRWVEFVLRRLAARGAQLATVSRFTADRIADRLGVPAGESLRTNRRFACRPHDGRRSARTLRPHRVVTRAAEEPGATGRGDAHGTR
jgi:hypothetical protein